MFDLLDSILSRGGAQLSVLTRDGTARTVTLAVNDAAQRKRLSDLSNLLGVIGFDFQEPQLSPMIDKVEPKGPAAQAGLQPGDRVLAIDDKPVREVHDLSEVSHDIAETPGNSIVMRYSRAGAEHTVQIPVTRGPDGRKLIGVLLSALAQYPPGMVVHKSLSPTAALDTAAGEAWDLTAMQGRLIWRMVLGQVSLKNLSGPIGIAQYAGESAEAGVASFLSFLVLISLAIAFFNLLPIPILDGGQIVFQAAEWVKGSPLSERTQAFGQQVGLALLVLLLGVALFNDVSRQLG
jgi:regulator of sigma E protease